mmetsp:Transcript_125055/g.198050  ORF Transcript_125055/g.198050 Transcript_125055/m.198050 type:complete len:508 (-) Transcript_125055:49-1572(-)
MNTLVNTFALHFQKLICSFPHAQVRVPMNWVIFVLVFAFLETETFHVAKRVVLEHRAADVDEKNRNEEPRELLGTVEAKDLKDWVVQVNSELELLQPLGMGGFGIAFDAQHNGKRRVVKFTSLNNKDARTWEEILVATPQYKNEKFQNRLVDMRDECRLQQQIKESSNGIAAVKTDPAGASALSECLMNCHPEATKCKTEEEQPPFIVVEYAGNNGVSFLRTSPGGDEICAVLNQIREGLRFMTEVRNPPVIHHDLKWENVCVRPKEEMEEAEFRSEFVKNYKAKLIDFGAAVFFVFHGTRTYQRTVGTLGYAPPEWFLRTPYDDPAWSFDVYALGAMSLYALCQVRHDDLVAHSQEMARLLWCSAEEVCVHREQCNNATLPCCPEDPEKLPKIVINVDQVQTKARTITCNVNLMNFQYAKKGDVDFSKARKDYARLRSYKRFHVAFCERVIPEERSEHRAVCKSMMSLLHPSPRWRLQPSKFRFDAAHGIVQNTSWTSYSAVAQMK